MRLGRVFYLIGRISLILGAAMVLPLAVALFYGDGDAGAFLRSIPVCLLAGLALMVLCRKQRKQIMRQRECYLFVTGVWVYAGLVGCLPFLFSGATPDFASAFFETISGFTTTGATVCTNIEGLGHGVLLWRSLSHWLGGAGIVLLFVALIQQNSTGEGMSLYKAEYSGGALSQRLAVRIEDNARIIFLVYLGLTLACLLCLLLCGMSLFDAVNHAFATVSTGGFSTRNASLAACNPASQWGIAGFLLLSGVNFSLYFLLLVRRRVGAVLRDNELVVYLAIAAGVTGLIFLSLHRAAYFPTAGEDLRHAFLQTASILTTGGFASDNFDQWPSLARGLLFLLLLVGGCSGSTASGVKVSRIVILAKRITQELIATFRPQQVRRVEYNGRRLEGEVSQHMLVFFTAYMMLTVLGMLVLMFTGVEWQESLSACLCTLGNVGPGWGSFGPVGNFAACTPLAKYVLCFLMLAGRLELFTMLVLFVPAVWKK